MKSISLLLTAGLIATQLYAADGDSAMAFDNSGDAKATPLISMTATVKG